MVPGYSDAYRNQSGLLWYIVEFCATVGIKLKYSSCPFFLSISTNNRRSNLRPIIVSLGNFFESLTQSEHYHALSLILILD